MRRSSINLECYFELGVQEYTVTIDHAHPGSPGSWDDPPEGPEIEWKNFVDVTIDGIEVGVVPWDVFVLEFASVHLISISDAEDKIQEKLYERYADYDPDYADYGDEEDEYRYEP